MALYLISLYIAYCNKHNYSKRDDITVEKGDYYV